MHYLTIFESLPKKERENMVNLIQGWYIIKAESEYIFYILGPEYSMLWCLCILLYSDAATYCIDYHYSYFFHE